jgi:hypothetical protein
MGPAAAQGITSRPVGGHARPADVTFPSGFHSPLPIFFGCYCSLYVHFFAQLMRLGNGLRISIHSEVTLVSIYLFEHLSRHQHRQHCRRLT